jgi:hypothetical protein
MKPTDEQIRELMATVACATCGENYTPTGIDVLGHRDDLWFLRVTCKACSSCGLVAALVKVPDGLDAEQLVPAAEPDSDDTLDRVPALGPVTEADVAGMRTFLDDFDGDFRSLFSAA